MNVITAMGDETLNNILRKEKEINIIGYDIQYQDGIFEILEKNNNIDYLLLNINLIGELNYIELIEKIKEKNKNINFIIFMEKENEKINKYLLENKIKYIFFKKEINYKKIIYLLKNNQKIFLDINNKKNNKIININKSIKNKLKNNNKKIKLNKKILKNNIKKYKLIKNNYKRNKLIKNKLIKNKKNKLINFFLFKIINKKIKNKIKNNKKTKNKLFNKKIINKIILFLKNKIIKKNNNKTNIIIFIKINNKKNKIKINKKFNLIKYEDKLFNKNNLEKEIINIIKEEFKMEILNNSLDEIKNDQNNSLDINSKNNLNINLKEKTQNFLETKLGQVVNDAIDFGIKVTLPDWIEDDIIDIKNSVFNDGFKEGLQLAINKAIDMGKAIEGIFTGKFDSVFQIKDVIKSGGLLDTVSKLLDSVINWAKDEKIISSSTAKLIKANKKVIMQNIENSINNTLMDQVEAIEKIDNYIDKWKNYFDKQDFTNMKKIYNKIEKQMEELVPIKGVLDKVEYVENLQQLIENNGNNFELSEEELELANILK